MTGKTSIEWATAVWNPTTGCTRVSAGCDNCYAFALHDKRYKSNRKAAGAGEGSHWNAEFHLDESRRQGRAMPYPKQYDRPFSRVQLLPGRLDDPLRHRKPERYFVDSMADLFHEDVPDEFIDLVFFTMSFATWHTFLVLTKRPERMRSYMEAARITKREHLPDAWAKDRLRYIDGTDLGRLLAGQSSYAYPPPNVWLGTSVEDQAAADERIPHLLATPAAVRFLSCEPLLGPVELRPATFNLGNCIRCLHPKAEHYFGESGGSPHCCWGAFKDECSCTGWLAPIDWVIVGGESGPRARPMDLAWARSLVAQCRAAGVAVFVKQLGSKPFTSGKCNVCDASGGDHAGAHGRNRDRKGGDMAEWPESLRVREFPR